MLTLSKIATYQRFGGDIDGWARSPKDADSSGMTDDDWFLIDELRQAFCLISSGLASTAFAARAEQRLLDATADEQTRQAVRRLALA